VKRPTACFRAKYRNFITLLGHDKNENVKIAKGKSNGT